MLSILLQCCCRVSSGCVAFRNGTTHDKNIIRQWNKENIIIMVGCAGKKFARDLCSVCKIYENVATAVNILYYYHAYSLRVMTVRYEEIVLHRPLSSDCFTEKLNYSKRKKIQEEINAL